MADRRNPLNLQVALCQEEGPGQSAHSHTLQNASSSRLRFHIFLLVRSIRAARNHEMHVIIVLNRISCRRIVDYCATFISRLKTDSRCEADVEQWDPSSMDMIMDDTN